VRAKRKTALEHARDRALKEFGVRVRAARDRQSLSQEALADKAHIARSYMSGIERGVRNCSVFHVMRIARALGVHPGELF
jgi:transcriptional regulator with XRE-family HTH domain